MASARPDSHGIDTSFPWKGLALGWIIAVSTVSTLMGAALVSGHSASTAIAAAKQEAFVAAPRGGASRASLMAAR